MDYKEDFFYALQALGCLPRVNVELEVKLANVEEEKRQVEDELARERKPVHIDQTGLNQA